MITALIITLAATVLAYTAGAVALAFDSDRVATPAVTGALVLVVADIVLGVLAMIGVGA